MVEKKKVEIDSKIEVTRTFCISHNPDKRPKFVYYSPTHLLLTSVSWDHADLYPTEADYFKVFEDLVAKTKIIVACNDDEGVKKVLHENKKVLTNSKNVV